MWLKRILISIGILAAVGGGGFILYNVAYAVGDANGYDEGYLAGQKVGYITGNRTATAMVITWARTRVMTRAKPLATTDGLCGWAWKPAPATAIA